ncbi:MAG: DUF5362 family protein [Bacillota bacterium]
MLIERDQLRELSKWAGFVGIMTIIFGAISAVFGLFAMIIGAIPGIIMIVLGVKLRNAKKYADQLLAAGPEGNDTSINMLFINLNNYFKIQGILIIIYLVLMALGMLSGALAGFAFMNMF